MKKILPILVMVFSLTASGQYYIGPGVGLNFNKMEYVYKNNEAEYDTKHSISFNTGIMAKHNINKNYAVRLGLMFSVKGTAYKSYPYYEQGNITGRVNIEDGYMKDEIYNLEIPVDIILSLKKWENSDFYIHCGPYLSLAFGGNRKFDYTYAVISNDTEIESGNKTGSEMIITKKSIGDEEYKDNNHYIVPFDFGANLGLGYRLYSFEFDLQFGLGISNLTPDYTGSNPGLANYNRKDWKLKNNIVSFGIIYFFEL